MDKIAQNVTRVDKGIRRFRCNICLLKQQAEAVICASYNFKAINHTLFFAVSIFS